MSGLGPLAGSPASNGRAAATPPAAVLAGRGGAGPAAPASIPVGNWEQSLVTRPAVVAYPATVAELVEIMRDRRAYPGPVRAIGSTHSTTACIAADGGTLVDMTAMNRIIDIGPDTVTAEAGALFIDVADALRERGLQFYVNVEIGNLTLGSAACCGTKEASFAGEFGQVGSYVTGIRLVTPSGKLIEVTRRHRRLLRLMRSSYGLLGLVCEVTLRVKPLRPMAVRHTTVRLDRLAETLPRLAREHQSVMLYVFPFTRRVGVELRDYRDGPPPKPHIVWKLRNWVWASAAPAFGYLVGRWVPGRALRALVVGGAGHLLAAALPLLRAESTAAPDQIIRYPVRSDWRRYTFSLWAFPEATYPDVLNAYAGFCREHERTHGYRSHLLTVGYRIGQDENALLSYSFGGPVITIDPVSNGGPGWPGFLDAFNRFALAFGGIPLLNQTDRLTPAQAREALRGRLRTFARLRRRFDPHDRLLSPYFRTLLEAPTSTPGEVEAAGEPPLTPTPTLETARAGDASGTRVSGEASGSRAPDEIANFGRTVRFAATLLAPRSEGDVLDILRRHAGRKIRVLGSLHSWSDVARSEDIALDMRKISGIEVTDDGVAPTARVGAGCTLGALLSFLRRRGLTLPTLGAIARQTVAGAVATATHGSGASSLSHFVREMRIATYRPGGGEPFILTLSADSSDLNEQAELRAARCSLGYLGVVLSLGLACRRRYAVEEELALVPTLDEALASVRDYPLQQFVLIPWAWKFYVLRRREIPDERAAGAWQWAKRMAYRGYKLAGVDVGIHGAIKLCSARSWDGASRWLMERALPAMAWSGRAFTDDSQRILTLNHDLYRHVEMEVFVPDRHLAAALALVRDITEAFAAGRRGGRPLPESVQRLLLQGVPEAAAELSWSGRYLNHYLITCRRVCPDDALIAMSSGGEGDWWSISVIAYRPGDPRFARYCRVLALCLASLYGGRPHWGKHFPLTHPVVETLYPGRLAEFRRICTRYDPGGVFRNAYAQRVLGFPAAPAREEFRPETAELTAR